MDHGAFPLFNRDRHLLTMKTLSDLCDPFMKHIGLLFQSAMFKFSIQDLQMNRMFFIRPIQTDAGRPSSCSFIEIPFFKNTRLASVLRRPYSGVLSLETRTASEYAMSDQSASSPLESPCQTVSPVGDVDS